MERELTELRNSIPLFSNTNRLHKLSVPSASYIKSKSDVPLYGQISSDAHTCV